MEVPPDIINEESSADIAVQEGEDATIVCKAVGHPTPRVTWKREDGEYMLLRKPQSRELIRARVELLLLLLLLLQPSAERQPFPSGEVGGAITSGAI
uniref:Ig-like domain-containing protein n=1 Tax=Anopheles epiroticus TaxID=199890 RepID=A0A182PE60_9DIPT